MASRTVSDLMRFSLKNAIAIAFLVGLVLLVVLNDHWIKLHLPWLYPFRMALVGLAIGVGMLFNALPGQPDAWEKPSLWEVVLTLLGSALFMYVFFDVASAIREKYPSWYLPFKAAILGAIAFGWRLVLKYGR